MAKSKRKFEPAFREEAVRLVREQKRSVADVARSPRDPREHPPHGG
jgi:transposase-like protein